MSRVGKRPITVPAGVDIKVNDQNLVTVKGPKGTLTQQVNPDITLKQDGDVLTLERPSDTKEHRALHGLYRALVANMVQGVSEGFTVKLELVGVGYKAALNGQVLDLSLGYSHGIMMALPPEIKAVTAQERGKSPTLTMQSHDKQLLGQITAKIRSLRKVEPYKGKGIRFEGEQIRRKAGKTSAK